MSRNFRGIGRPDITGNGCWVFVDRHINSLYGSATSCGCRPRPGMLTCRYHAQYEQEAQTLARRLAARAKA